MNAETATFDKMILYDIFLVSFCLFFGYLSSILVDLHVIFCLWFNHFVDNKEKMSVKVEEFLCSTADSLKGQ